MKTFNLLALVLFLVQGHLLAGGIVPLSRWKTHPILIDGNDSDWDKPINFYDDRHGLFFAIRNDSARLYLNFTAIDPQKIQAVTTGGWTLVFSAKNKKTKTRASLTFGPLRSGGMHNRMGMDEKLNFASGSMPGPNVRPPVSGSGKPEQSDSALANKLAVMDYARNLHTFIARGFIFTHDEVSVLNTAGIAVRAGLADPSGLLYEIAIPLNELFEEGSVRLDEQISMSITVNAAGQAMSQPREQPQGSGGGMEPRSRGGGGRPGGTPGGGMGGGMHGSGMRGGGPGGESQGNSVRSSEKEVFKQKFKLSSR